VYIVLTYVLDSDIQNKFINKSVDTFSVSENELMLNKYNVLESKYNYEFNYFKIFWIHFYKLIIYNILYVVTFYNNNVLLI